jgi:hypothetical protein
MKALLTLVLAVAFGTGFFALRAIWRDRDDPMQRLAAAETEHDKVWRKAYWYPVNTGEVGVPCIPKGTRVITQHTPTIFRAECPKGWKPTLVYYKPASGTAHLNRG